MVCLGFEPRVAGWKAQTNPLSYGGTPYYIILTTATAEKVHSFPFKLLSAFYMNEFFPIQKFPASNIHRAAAVTR